MAKYSGKTNSRKRNSMRSKKRTYRRPGFRGVTTQHDSATIYSYKKPNGKKVKAYKKFAKKVHEVEDKNQGKATLIIQGTEIANIPGPKQMISEINLFSVNGTNSGAHDMDSIFNEITSTRLFQNNSALGEHLTFRYANDKFTKSVRILSASLDITYFNNGTVPIECDLYCMKHKDVKLENYTQTAYALTEAPAPVNMGQASQQVETYQDTMQFYDTTAGTWVYKTRPDLATRGATPFDFVALNKSTGSTVVSQSKFFIPPKGSATRRFTHNRPFTVFPHAELPYYRYDKHTLSYLLLAKNTDADVIAQELKVSFTKHYRWTTPTQDTDRIGVLIEAEVPQ